MRRLPAAKTPPRDVPEAASALLHRRMGTGPWAGLGQVLFASSVKTPFAVSLGDLSTGTDQTVACFLFPLPKSTFAVVTFAVLSIWL